MILIDPILFIFLGQIFELFIRPDQLSTVPVHPNTVGDLNPATSLRYLFLRNAFCYLLDHYFPYNLH